MNKRDKFLTEAMGLCYHEFSNTKNSNFTQALMPNVLA